MVLTGNGIKAHTRPDPEKFFPTKIRMTLIQVSAGAKYDPKLVPNLPPTAGEKRQGSFHGFCRRAKTSVRYYSLPIQVIFFASMGHSLTRLHSRNFKAALFLPLINPILQIAFPRHWP